MSSSRPSPVDRACASLRDPAADAFCGLLQHVATASAAAQEERDKVCQPYCALSADHECSNKQNGL